MSILLLSKANPGTCQRPQLHWIPAQLKVPSLATHLGHANVPSITPRMLPSIHASSSVNKCVHEMREEAR